MSGSGSMTEYHRKRLRDCRTDLVKDMDPDPILDELISKGKIQPPDENRVKAKATREEQVRELLGIIPRKGDDCFGKLCDALRKNKQESLADTLERE